MAIPIPYQLDILGGLQFENLIQELLIAELGLGVEAWGGSADHGKDSYCASELNFPDRRITNSGPFIFQAKFISGANATGAKFDKDFISAIARETELIQARIERKMWKRPGAPGAGFAPGAFDSSSGAVSGRHPLSPSI